MKNKPIILMMLIASTVLSACTPNPSVETISEEIVPEDNTAPQVETVTITVEEAMMAYTDYLKKIFEGDEEKAEGVRYTLAYINNDDIPELVFMDEASRSAGGHVLICDNNLTVSDIGEFGEYGSLAYKERQGMILSYYTGQGIAYADFYRLEGLSLIDDTYFEIDSPILEGEQTRYYVDGDETGEISYYEAYSAKETSKYTYLYYEDALPYADTDDVLRVLEEYAKTGKKPSIINVESEYPDLVGEWILSQASIGSSSEYLPASEAGASSYLKITSNGIKFKMTYEDITVEDENMSVTYVNRDAVDKRFSCIGFKNEDGTREFLVFTGENNTVMVNMTEMSGQFSTHSFVFVYIKTEDEL